LIRSQHGAECGNRIVQPAPALHLGPQIRWQGVHRQCPESLDGLRSPQPRRNGLHNRINSTWQRAVIKTREVAHLCKLLVRCSTMKTAASIDGFYQGLPRRRYCRGGTSSTKTPIYLHRSIVPKIGGVGTGSRAQRLHHNTKTSARTNAERQQQLIDRRISHRLHRCMTAHLFLRHRSAETPERHRGRAWDYVENVFHLYKLGSLDASSGAQFCDSRRSETAIQ